ncbi:MAG: general secretion pathway protein J [Arenicella sp.]
MTIISRPEHNLFKSSSGFTLLEIMVAVAIFGVIASIVFPALLQFLDMRERVDEKHQQISGLQKTFQFLANDLRFASNRLSKDEYGDVGKTTLSINDDYLIDLTALYSDLSLQGLAVPRRVRWQLVDGVLQRVQFPVMDPEVDTRVMIQSLLENVEDVEIKVSHIADGREKTDSDWEEQKRLPDLIDVTVKLGKGIEYRWVFSMLGADSDAATEAVLNAQAPK